jgi:hypothetical protein
MPAPLVVILRSPFAALRAGSATKDRGVVQRSFAALRMTGNGLALTANRPPLTGPLYFATPNVKTVRDRYVWPGRRIVVGKFGWFGESGKCWVSSATAER